MTALTGALGMAGGVTSVLCLVVAWRWGHAVRYWYPSWSIWQGLAYFWLLLLLIAPALGALVAYVLARGRRLTDGDYVQNDSPWGAAFDQIPDRAETTVWYSTRPRAPCTDLVQVGGRARHVIVVSKWLDEIIDSIVARHRLLDPEASDAETLRGQLRWFILHHELAHCLNGDCYFFAVLDKLAYWIPVWLVLLLALMGATPYWWPLPISGQSAAELNYSMPQLFALAYDGLLWIVVFAGLLMWLGWKAICRCRERQADRFALDRCLGLIGAANPRAHAELSMLVSALLGAVESFRDDPGNASSNGCLAMGNTAHQPDEPSPGDSAARRRAPSNLSNLFGTHPYWQTRVRSALAAPGGVQDLDLLALWSLGSLATVLLLTALVSWVFVGPAHALWVYSHWDRWACQLLNLIGILTILTPLVIAVFWSGFTLVQRWPRHEVGKSVGARLRALPRSAWIIALANILFLFYAQVFIGLHNLALLFSISSRVPEEQRTPFVDLLRSTYDILISDARSAAGLGVVLTAVLLVGVAYAIAQRACLSQGHPDGVLGRPPPTLIGLAGISLTACIMIGLLQPLPQYPGNDQPQAGPIPTGLQAVRENANLVGWSVQWASICRRLGLVDAASELCAQARLLGRSTEQWALLETEAWSTFAQGEVKTPEFDPFWQGMGAYTVAMAAYLQGSYLEALDRLQKSPVVNGHGPDDISPGSYLSKCFSEELARISCKILWEENQSQKYGRDVMSMPMQLSLIGVETLRVGVHGTAAKAYNALLETFEHSYQAAYNGALSCYLSGARGTARQHLARAAALSGGPELEKLGAALDWQPQDGWPARRGPHPPAIGTASDHRGRTFDILPELPVELWLYAKDLSWNTATATTGFRGSSVSVDRPMAAMVARLLLKSDTARAKLPNKVDMDRAGADWYDPVPAAVWAIVSSVPTRAEEYLSRWLGQANSPDNRSLPNLLRGWLQAEAGDMSSAVESFARCRANSPREEAVVPVLSWLGECQGWRKLGRAAEVEAAERQALYTGFFVASEDPYTWTIAQVAAIAMREWLSQVSVNWHQARPDTGPAALLESLLRSRRQAAARGATGETTPVRIIMPPGSSPVVGPGGASAARNEPGSTPDNPIGASMPEVDPWQDAAGAFRGQQAFTIAAGEVEEIPTDQWPLRLSESRVFWWRDDRAQFRGVAPGGLISVGSHSGAVWVQDGRLMVYAMPRITASDEPNPLSQGDEAGDESRDEPSEVVWRATLRSNPDFRPAASGGPSSYGSLRWPTRYDLDFMPVEDDARLFDIQAIRRTTPTNAGGMVCYEASNATGGFLLNSGGSLSLNVLVWLAADSGQVLAERHTLTAVDCVVNPVTEELALVNRGPNPTDPYMATNLGLTVVSRRGIPAGRQPFVAPEGQVASPSWLADGDSLVAQAGGQLWWFARDGRRRQLTRSGGWLPSARPDGLAVAYWRWTRAGWELRHLTIADGVDRRLAALPEPWKWSAPDPVQWSPDGHWLLITMPRTFSDPYTLFRRIEERSLGPLAELSASTMPEPSPVWLTPAPSDTPAAPGKPPEGERRGAVPVSVLRSELSRAARH